jgi:phage terminase large subunit-like protein
MDRARIMLQDELAMQDPQTKVMVQTVLDRARQYFYQFEPYFNRSNGAPSWQWEYIMNARNKGRVALGGNRIGKSECGAYDLCLAITGKHPAREYPVNGRAWVVGLDRKVIEAILLRKFDKLLPQNFKHRFHKADLIWECVGEGREWIVTFKSAESGREKFQGDDLDFVWLDEEPPMGIFSEVEARLLDRSGNWGMTATPVKGTAWLKALSEREGVVRTFAGMIENPYLPEDEVEAFAKTLSDDERAVRVMGEYIQFGGRPVFPRLTLTSALERISKAIEPRVGILEELAA